MPITELNHYLLVAKNLERTKKFYQKVLGLQLAGERPDFGFPGYWLKAGGNICVHLASQAPNRIRDQFLLKKHPKGTKGSGSVDHIAFLAKKPEEVRKRIQKHALRCTTAASRNRSCSRSSSRTPMTSPSSSISSAR